MYIYIFLFVCCMRVGKYKPDLLRTKRFNVIPILRDLFMKKKTPENVNKIVQYMQE